jgi:hypothetical protein
MAYNNRADFIRQGGNGFVNVRFNLAPIRLNVRRERAHELVLSRSSSPRLTQPVQGTMRRKLVQPLRKKWIGCRLDGHQPEKTVLSYILGVRGIPENAAARAKHHARMPRDNLRKGFRVAMLDPSVN